MRLLFAGDGMLPQLLREGDTPVGGWAVQQLQLVEALAAAGHSVGVLVPKGTKDYVGSQEFGELVETYDVKRGIPKIRFFYPGLIETLSAARSYAPDVIIQSCSGIHTAAMAWVAGRLGVPFVHRIASDADTDGRYVLYLRLPSRTAFRYGLKRAHFVICQNTYQVTQIKQNFPAKQAAILHNAIAMSSAGFDPLPRPERTHVAWLAAFRKGKNLPLLLDIARQLPEVEFRVAGKENGETDPETASALNGLRKLGNVRFVGYLRRSEVADFLGRAIALLCTSDYEGFSNTFLEAWAAGTPVVTRGIVDPDSITARNGLGFVARDEAELAQAMRQACSLDTPDFDALSLKCRSYVEAHHTPASAAGKLISVLEPVVAASKKNVGGGPIRVRGWT